MSSSIPPLFLVKSSHQFTGVTKRKTKKVVQDFAHAVIFSQIHEIAWLHVPISLRKFLIPRMFFFERLFSRKKVFNQGIVFH